MGYMINVALVSGLITDFTQPEAVDFGNGTILKKTTILISYSDLNTNKLYKIPVEILCNDNKMQLLAGELRVNNPISIDARLISTQYMNKSTGKPITYLKLDPYVIYFVSSGKQIIFKSRYTGNPANGYPGRGPYANMPVEQAQQVVQQTVDSMRSEAIQSPPTPLPDTPKPGQGISSQPLPDDDIPF